MGCDLHSYVEGRDVNGEWRHLPWEPLAKFESGPFDWRSYGVFGWLADVRNYSAVPPIAGLRGLPDDVSSYVAEEFEAFGLNSHSASYLTVDELVAFDFDASFEDRRVTRNGNGGVTAEPCGGRVVTFREFLGQAFFRHLNVLSALNAHQPIRIIFWFDS